MTGVFVGVVGGVGVPRDVGVAVGTVAVLTAVRDGDADAEADARGLAEADAVAVTIGAGVSSSMGPVAIGGSYGGIAGRSATVAAVSSRLAGPTTSMNTGPRLRAISAPCLS